MLVPAYYMRQRRAASESGSDPYSISDLIIGVEGDRGLQSSGGDVTQWDDQETGDADGASNFTPPANAPTHNTGNALFDGQPTVDFDAVNSEYLDAPLFASPRAEPMSLVLVFSIADVSTRQYIHDGQASGGRVIVRINAGGDLYVDVGGGTPGAGGSTLVANTVYMVVVQLDGTNADVYLDDMGTVDQTDPASGAQLDGARLGASSNEGDFLGGSVYAYYLYGKALSQTERETIKTYLQKAGVTV